MVLISSCSLRLARVFKYCFVYVFDHALNLHVLHSLSADLGHPWGLHVRHVGTSVAFISQPCLWFQCCFDFSGHILRTSSVFTVRFLSVALFILLCYLLPWSPCFRPLWLLFPPFVALASVRCGLVSALCGSCFARLTP